MGLWMDICYEIKRLVESLRGKWSFEIWMNTIGDFTDELIRKTESKDGSKYQSGFCEVDPSNPSEIVATVKLYFLEVTGEQSEYEAKRSFSKTKFLSEALRKIEVDGITRYPIDAPKD